MDILMQIMLDFYRWNEYNRVNNRRKRFLNLEEKINYYEKTLSGEKKKQKGG